MNNQLSEDEPRVEAVTSHSLVDHEFPSQSTYFSVLQETQSVSDAGGPVVFQARQAKGSMTSSSVF